MGYILPIRYDQCNEYQKRISKKKTDNYFIEKPFKVVLETRYEEIKGKPRNQSLNKMKLTQAPLDSRPIYAALGKGKLFSDKV